MRWNLAPGTWDLGSGIRNPESGTRDRGSCTVSANIVGISGARVT